MADESGRGRGPLAGLSPTVIRLGWVSFFTDLASEMLYPLTPIFLTALLGVPVAVVGVIEGVAEATASFLKTLSGRWSDASGKRRPYVLAGYSVSAVAKPLIGFANGWGLVLFARVADRFGKGVRSSARDALLADTTPQEDRGRAFGWHRAMDTSGAVLGPLVGLLLLKLCHENLRLVFFMAVIPGICSALLVFTIQERRREGPPKSKTDLSLARLPATFRRYLLAWGVFSIANSSDVFLLLLAKEHYDALTPVVLLYVLYNVVYAAASPALGGMSDRLGRRRVLVGGLLVFALVYIGLATVQATWALWVLFAIYGLYTAATDGVGKAFAVDLVPKELRASAVGVLGTVTGIATLLASSIAGGLWTGVAPWATFVYGALGALLGAALLPAGPPREEG